MGGGGREGGPRLKLFSGMLVCLTCKSRATSFFFFFNYLVNSIFTPSPLPFDQVVLQILPHFFKLI